MINFPNAKINLGLQITEKRDDGYHNIDSCFYPIPLEDILEVIPADQDEFVVYGLTIPGEQKNNLIWKAYQLLKSAFKLPALSISLYKNIPMGAGMGGGSADGSFMLKLLNHQFQLGLSQDELTAYALQLGSDCPFFIENRAAYVQGRGELLSEITIDLSGWHLGLIYPGIHIGTKEAYATITPNSNRESTKAIIEQNPIKEWKNHLTNDFEASVFKLHPQLASFKSALYEAGAVYAAMSGSGSTLFGLFETKQEISFIDHWVSL